MKNFKPHTQHRQDTVPTRMAPPSASVIINMLLEPVSRILLKSIIDVLDVRVLYPAKLQHISFQNKGIFLGQHITMITLSKVNNYHGMLSHVDISPTVSSV